MKNGVFLDLKIGNQTKLLSLFSFLIIKDVLRQRVEGSGLSAARYQRTSVGTTKIVERWSQHQRRT
jgi:hypothetical protein